VDDTTLFANIYSVIEHAVHPEHAPAAFDPRTSKAAQELFRLVKKAAAGPSASCTKVLHGGKPA